MRRFWGCRGAKHYHRHHACLVGHHVVIVLAGRLVAEPVEWKVVSVHDGDTFTAVDAANVQHKVRLQGIDAPEVKQAFGTKSRDRLAALTLRKVVRVNVHDHDRYGRVLADIDADGRGVNKQMLADGMAWHYTRYSKDAGLAAAERDARAARRGLWAGGTVGVACQREGPQG